MSKIMSTSLATAAALAALVTAVPTASMAQANGITNCDAPGGRQAVVARNERTAGTVVGAGAGAAAGSYIGCNQQRARAAAQVNASGAQYRASSNLRIRSGPGTSFRQAGSLRAGQPFTAIGSQGEWVQIAGGGWVNAHYVQPY